ncbi:AraC family transcriptional regulator [Parafilimonas sp.]|uniref:AraC family transcriptional regulator n=1 Tax=Parafilimonas sp. TaxID=1969739 RepID=UPI0039E61735
MSRKSSLDTLSSNERKIIDLRQYGFQNVVVLGKYNYTQAKEQLPLHTHRSMMEICFCSKGEQEYEVNENVYKIKGGDLFVTYPGEPHGTGKFPEEKGELYWIIIRINKKNTPTQFLRFEGELAEEWQNQLLQLPRLFKGNSQLKPMLEKIINFKIDKKNLFSLISMQHLIAGYLLEVINCSKKEIVYKQSGKIVKVNNFLEAHLDEPVSVPELARVAGLSVSRFKSWFKQETGTTPLDYALKYKITKAKKLLKKTKASVTSIAFETGFPNSQYFATVFKKFTGFSPTAYKTHIVDSLDS